MENKEEGKRNLSASDEVEKQLQAALKKYCDDGQKSLDAGDFIQTMLSMSQEIDLVAQSEQGQLFFEESNLRGIYDQIN